MLSLFTISTSFKQNYKTTTQQKNHYPNNNPILKKHKTNTHN